jgi:heme exporter protein A
MLLSLRNVARFYGPRLIFRDVSLDVPEGSVTLLTGANGAGKSTLLGIMAGLIRPSAGEVLLRDKGKEEIRIGFLGHRTFLYPGLSALENLRFWASLHAPGLPEAAFEAILERLELAPFAGEKAGIFSRGMAQRLSLARVFLPAPDILLLDEPGAGLDTRSTAVLHREIAAAREAGAGIVWVTHRPEEDARRADRIARLEGGGLRCAETAARIEPALPPPAHPDPFALRTATGGEPC